MNKKKIHVINCNMLLTCDQNTFVQMLKYKHAYYFYYLKTQKFRRASSCLEYKIHTSKHEETFRTLRT